MKAKYTLTILAVFGVLMATNAFCQDYEQGGEKQDVNSQRGVAIIASSIGTDYRVEDLAKLLEKGKFSPLVIDWAWITYHWERTKFDEVNRLIESAKHAGIAVAAMYRPRFLSDPTIPTQVDKNGKNDPQDGFEINYSDPEARKWGIEWGNEILTKCPGFDEIIIYHPRNMDMSPKTLELEKKNPNARNDAIWQFMREARQAWGSRKLGLRLGVVAMPEPEFWKRGVKVIDSAYPFFCVRNDENLQDQLNAFNAVRKTLGKKMRAVLTKVTWEEERRVSPAVFAQFNKLVQSHKIPHVFWEFETLIDTGKYTLSESARILSVTPDDLAAFASNKTRQKTGCEPKTRGTAVQKDVLLEDSGKVPENNSEVAEKQEKIIGKGGADVIPYAHMYEDFPSIKQADLGLEKLGGKASLVYCSKGKKRLAGQIQTMLESMHLMARDAAGACVRIHGLIVIGNRSELPAKVRDAHWLNVDRVPCLVQELSEDSLPLQNDFNQYMIFELLLHESVDIGIKEEFGRQGQMGSLMKEDIRWIVEGLACFCAGKACQQFEQYGAIRFATANELKSLQKVTTPALNLEENATWYPAGYKDPEDADYAYAAAHYVFARLASKHGEEWIRKTLGLMKSACVKKNTPAGSAEFCEIAGGLLHEDVRGLVQGVNVGEVKAFTESLLPAATKHSTRQSTDNSKESVTTSAAIDSLLEKIDDAQQKNFENLKELIQIANNGGAGVKENVFQKAKAIIENPTSRMSQRWMCCYVLSGIRNELAIPVLAKVLFTDPDTTVRSVAACALGEVKSQEARAALEKAAGTEKDTEVLGEIKKALKQ